MKHNEPTNPMALQDAYDEFEIGCEPYQLSTAALDLIIADLARVRADREPVGDGYYRHDPLKVTVVTRVGSESRIATEVFTMDRDEAQGWASEMIADVWGGREPEFAAPKVVLS